MSLLINLFNTFSQELKTMETRKILSTLFISIFIAAIFVTPETSHADENAAKSILKSMSDYIGSQKTIEFTFDSGIEIITPELEKIQFTNSGEAKVNRPNKLWAHRIGGYADVTMFYDGKTVSVYGKHINGYFQTEAPANIDMLVLGTCPQRRSRRVSSWCRPFAL
jgi:hypothetical protein